MPENISVAAVVVTYNRKPLLEECIASLLKQSARADLRVYVVDNASTDGTGEAMREYARRGEILYFHTGANLGGAGGFEYGIREAAKGPFDYIWVMDDDTIPTGAALQALLDAAEELSPFGFLSSHALWSDGSVCTMNVQRKDIMRKLKLSELRKRVIPVEYATFVSLLIPMSVARELGAPIGEFFIWGDDWEYTRRISKKYKSYVVTDSKVIHKTAHNKGCDISNDRPDRIARYRYAFRNEAFVARRDGVKGMAYRYLKVIKNLLKIAAFSPDNKSLRFRTVLEGVREGRTFHPSIQPIEY